MSAAAVARTLLLSTSYEPIGPISWKRAITLLTLGKVEVLEEYDSEVRTISFSIKIPAVVRLLTNFCFGKLRCKGPRLSRANVLARDNHTCQYCGNKKPLRELNLDHVIPRTQGGQTNWNNIVTACVRCNLKKGGRTPEQAGMKLLSKPHEPRWIPAIKIAINVSSIPDAWRDYLYWMSELDE